MKTLVAVGGNLGNIVAGSMQNASGTFVIDLDATGSDPLIDHPNFEVRADGTAVFSGDLSAAGGTFSGTVTASAFTASTATFTGSVIVEAAVGGTAYWLTNSAFYIRTGGAQNLALRRGGSDGVIEATDGDLILQASGVVDFNFTADTSGRTALGEYLPVKVSGTTRYLRLYS